MKNCFVKYSHEKFLLFNKDKSYPLSSSPKEFIIFACQYLKRKENVITNKNNYCSRVSSSSFYLHSKSPFQILLFSHLKFICIHNTTGEKNHRDRYFALFFFNSNERKNWLDLARLREREREKETSMPTKQESQRPKANFKGSSRGEKKA